MNHYLSVVRECLETGISPRCHLEDITRSDIYGFVIPFCLELMHLMEEYIPVKIRVCDTMGYGINYPGAVIPRSIPVSMAFVFMPESERTDRVPWT